eukprot:15467010-Alexandrium_andersonii.AAC.1
MWPHQLLNPSAAIVAWGADPSQYPTAGDGAGDPGVRWGCMTSSSGYPRRGKTTPKKKARMTTALTYSPAYKINGDIPDDDLMTLLQLMEPENFNRTKTQGVHRDMLIAAFYFGTKQRPDMPIGERNKGPHMQGLCMIHAQLRFPLRGETLESVYGKVKAELGETRPMQYMIRDGSGEQQVISNGRSSKWLPKTSLGDGGKWHLGVSADGMLYIADGVVRKFMAELFPEDRPLI